MCYSLTGQSYDAYNDGFNLIKEALPKNKSFGTHGYPNIFMTDNSAAEINTLINNWPNSRHLLCIFHVLQAVWRWLWDTKNNIPKESRKILMKTFQNILYSNTVEKAEQAYLNSNHSKYDNWNKYVSSYWEFKTKWCLAWRDGTVKGHQTNNFSELTVRIFKDIVLSRVKAYNVIALIDFVCTVLEEYYCRRFREFANSRNSKARLFLQSQTKKAHDIKSENVIQITENEYEVVISSDKSYEVNTKIGTCSCHEGHFGSFCSHQCVVYLYYDVVSKNFPPITAEDKYTISVLAQGDKSLPISFFESFLPNSISTPHASSINCTKIQSINQELLPVTLTSINENPLTLQIAKNEDNENISMENITLLMKNLDIKFGSSTSGLKMIETRLKKICTEGMWESFLHTAGSSVPIRRRSGTAIKVQPTSIVRRSLTLTRGSKRFPVGRPATQEQLKKKRKRNLGINIKNNLPNAKSHGSGH